MARRSPLLLLIALPFLALGALYLLDEEPRAPECVAGEVVPAPGPEAPAVALAAAAEPEALPVPVAESAPDRRVVGSAARIEGRVLYTNGAMPGGKVLVYASVTGATWQWERAGRRIHAGLDADSLVHGFADADGHFVLEWTGNRSALAVAAMAPTAATETTVRWRATDTDPLTLTLEPRAALFVDVRGGAGFDVTTAPDFCDTELRLQIPDVTTSDVWYSTADGEQDTPRVPAARRKMSGWVDATGRATFVAVAIDRDFEVVYKGSAAVETARTVPALSNGEQRAMVLEPAAGAHLVGRVVDELGAPVASASLAVYAATKPNRLRTALAFAGSDTEGRFEMRRVPREAKFVEVSKEGFPTTQHELGAELVDGVRRDLGDLLLEFGTSFGGQVWEPDGRPAAGAKIIANTNTEIEGPKRGPLQWHHEVCTADAEGRFAFRGLPKGFHFDLIAESALEGTQAKGYLEAVRDGDFDLVVVLDVSPALQGRVVKPDGQPMPWAEVRGMSEGDTVAPWEDAVSPAIAHTDKDGRFRLELEEPGTVLLEASARGYAPSPIVAANVRSSTPVELRLRHALSVWGTVVDSVGQPVRGASVGKYGEYDGYATSNAEGRFHIADRAPGELVLVARHPKHASSDSVLVELGSGLATPDIVLTLRRGAVVRGVLYQKGERAGAGVEIIAGPSVGVDRRETLTNEAGEFVFERLSPGLWNFMSMGTLSAADATTDAERAAVAAQMPRQSLVLADGGAYRLTLGPTTEAPVQVSGVVRSAGKELPRCELFFVRLHAGDSDQCQATVDAAGRYELVVRQPGSYRVTARGGGAGSLGSFVHLRVEIPAQPIHELDIDLPGGAIRGQVFGPEGAPVPNLLVSLHREDGVAVGMHQGAVVGLVPTDGRGRFEFPLLQPGSYRVAAGGKTFFDFPGAPPTSGRVLSAVVLLRDDEAQTVDLRLASPGEVHGRVRDRSGKPVPSARIFARDASGTPLGDMSVAQSDPTGRFEWSGLAPGDYTFEAKSFGLASAESARVTVRAGAVAEVELVVEEAAYLIVSVEGANPAELAQGLLRLDVHDAHNRQAMGLPHPEDFGDFDSVSTPNEHRVGPLAPGSYRASVTAPSGQRVEGTVELRAGDERRLTLRLQD